MQRRDFNRLTLIILMLFTAARLFVTQSPATAHAATWPGRLLLAQQGAVLNPNELLAFEVNRPVTTGDRGFPKDDPPQAAANGDWTTPINFAEGIFYYRVEVRSQPQPQAMRMQFCIWQDNFVLENCGPLADVSGEAGTVITWSKPVQEIWKKDDKSIDWNRPRQRYGIAIKNSQNLPVSDYNGWNWNGENPNVWYPLDVRISVVVVAKDQDFSGWHNYIEGLPTPTSTPTSTPAAISTPTPIPQPTATATDTATPSATATTKPRRTVAPTSTITPTVLPSDTATATNTATVPPTTPTTGPTATPTTPSSGGKSGSHKLFLPTVMR